MLWGRKESFKQNIVPRLERSLSSSHLPQNLNIVWKWISLPGPRAVKSLKIALRNLQGQCGSGRPLTLKPIAACEGIRQRWDRESCLKEGFLLSSPGKLQMPLIVKWVNLISLPNQLQMRGGDWLFKWIPQYCKLLNSLPCPSPQLWHCVLVPAVATSFTLLLAAPWIG